jgi:aldehyde dehydrogenase (NAD+)
VQQTFKTGRTKPYNYRMQQLKNLRDGMTKMRPELDRALTQDLGKETFVNWMFEFLLIEREIDHTLANLKDWMEDVCVDTPMAIGPGKSYIQREPLGVVVILGAWNFPFSTALGPMIDAMAAGNTVVLKPSELAPHVAKATELLFRKYLDPNSY